MDIIKRLKICGPNGGEAGVLISDQGETYPLFMDTLVSKKFFNVMIENGYTLIGLPYEFEKDGVSIMDLPCEEFHPDDIVLSDMYNNMGVAMSINDLKPYLKPKKSLLDMPATEYSILTREEFLKYLEGIEVYNLPEDYLPINYFVSPAARFSLNEYLDPANSRYVNIIESRRRMSLAKFDKLYKFLTDKGLIKGSTAQDVLDAYFAWGIDGLNLELISRSRKRNHFILTPHAATQNTTPAIRTVNGLIDGRGSILPPLDKRDIVWNLPSRDPSYIDALTKGLAPDDTTVVTLQCNMDEEVTTLCSTSIDVNYSSKVLMIAGVSSPTISVQDPSDPENYMNLDYALPNKRQLLTDKLTIAAVAKELQKHRVVDYKISSWELLQLSGFGPEEAVMHIANITGLSEPQDVKQLCVSLGAIHQYFETGSTLGVVLPNMSVVSNPDDAQDLDEMIENIIDGTINIDNLDAAKRLLLHLNVQELADKLECAHTVLGIPIKEICENVKALTPEDKVLTFTNGIVKLTLNVGRIDPIREAVKKDLLQYEIASADTCANIFFVTRVATETGDEANRHVGFDSYCLVRDDVAPVIGKLRAEMEDLINTKIESASKRDNLLKNLYVIVLRQLMDILMKGTIPYPSIFGIPTKNADPADVRLLRNKALRRIESTVGYGIGSYTYDARTFKSYNYCVNAYITPFYVIPRSGCEIPENEFNAVWPYGCDVPATPDYESNRRMFARLVDDNVLPRDFGCWNFNYAGHGVISDLADIKSQISLTTYRKYSNDMINSYPKDKEFKGIPHIVEYTYPGLTKFKLGCNDPDATVEDLMFENRATLEIPREGKPVYHISRHRTITFEDLAHVLSPVPVSNEDPDQYLRRFSGFSAEAFMFCPDILNKMPDTSKPRVAVYSGSEEVFLPQEGTAVNFRRIHEFMNNYAITNPYGRLYLILANDGSIWEARV